MEKRNACWKDRLFFVTARSETRARGPTLFWDAITEVRNRAHHEATRHTEGLLRHWREYPHNTGHIARRETDGRHLEWRGGGQVHHFLGRNALSGYSGRHQGAAGLPGRSRQAHHDCGALGDVR